MDGQTGTFLDLSTLRLDWRSSDLPHGDGVGAGEEQSGIEFVTVELLSCV